MTTPPKPKPAQPANPTVFTETFPNAEVPEVLKELNDEGVFDVIKQTPNNDGTTTITVQIKAGQ